MTSGANKGSVTKLVIEPTIVTRDQHNVSRRDISDGALKVLYRLKNAGYQAYLVGGGVRDLLLGLAPKDFDVATDALPEQIRELFRNSRLIGRRFRLAHVRFGPEILEVATFRAGEHLHGDRITEAGRILRDNVYGDIGDDVWRRDFTANSLYYNISDFSIVDYAGGMNDIRDRRLRLIGDPVQRYQEDPVRLLRAVRFTVKLDFEMDEATARPIPEMAPLLRDIPPARLFEEVLKLFLGGFAAKSFQPLRDYRLLDWLLPQLEHSLNGKRGEQTLRLVQRVLDNTDARLRDGKPVTPAFLFAAFLWEPMVEASERFMSDGVPQLEALQLASDEVISKQVAAVAVPRRLTKITREIWTLQPRFARTTEKRAARLFAHPRFRAAYDFLVLRRESGEDLGELCDWWEHYQEGRPPVVHAEKPRRSRRRPPD